MRHTVAIFKQLENPAPPQLTQREREDAYVVPETAEWLKHRQELLYSPPIPPEQRAIHSRDLSEETYMVYGPICSMRLNLTEDRQDLERKRLDEAMKEQQQIFKRVVVSKSPFERASLWRRLINQSDQMGDGISKELSKLYLCWFRTTCLDREASLEFEDETGEVMWNGIMMDVDQLTELTVRRISCEPIEQSLNMIRKCSKYIAFSGDQQQRLQASIFSSGQLKMNQFVKMFRKALEFNLFDWTPIINILHEGMKRWGVSQMKRLTKEYFNQAEFRTLWHKMSQLMEANDIVEMQVPMNYVLQPRVFQYWNEIQARWRWSNEATSTEEVLLERVNMLVDMWRWYGEVIRTEEQNELSH
jgi:hypothetical protein